MVDELHRRTTGAVVSSGWLGASAGLDYRERHMARALATSLVIHGAVLAALVAVVAVGPAREFVTEVAPLVYKTVLMPDPGPGGGGGGNPKLAPRKPMEVPPHQAPTVVPVAAPAPQDPPPALIASIQTDSTLLQASGTSLLSLSRDGGSGKGNGIGSGDGDGVGPGKGSGSGDGPPAPGNGISWPEAIAEVKPKYTAEAMRQKVQGTVHLEIVILESGRVGNVRVTRSLTPDLDQAAIAAAKQWVFVPAKQNGKPIAVRVPLMLEFRLH
jgi:TonB family protein